MTRQAQTVALPAGAPRPKPAYWLAAAGPALALALATGLLWLACRPLLPVDETRYLSVAWEMWLRGDFIVPYKNGAVYVDKPPLLFWLMHGGWALFGVNAWWPRLVPTLAAMASLLLTARLAAQLWPGRPQTARLAPWILATTLLWQAFTGAVMFDTLLSVFALLCLNALVAPPLGRARWVWFALGIGGGLLTKGPVILLHTLPAAVLAPLWWPAGGPGPHRWRRWYGGLLLGLIGGMAIIMAWLVPAILRAGASYGAAIGIHQTTDRLVHSYSHRRPWWWYLPLLPLLTLPWSLWPPLYRGLERLRGAQDAGVRFCLTATLPALLIFCVISGKQAHYLLPLLAPAAALVARALAGLETPTTRLSGLPLALLLAACGLAILALPHVQGPHAPDWTRQIPVPVPAALLLAAALLGWPRRLDPVAASYRTGLVFALAFGVVYAGNMQALAPRYRLTAFAGHIAAAQARGAPVAHIGKYHAQFQFLGRLRQPLNVLHSEQLAAWAAAHPDGYVVYPCKRWRPAPTGVYGQPYRGGGLRLWPVALLPPAPSEERLCGD